MFSCGLVTPSSSLSWMHAKQLWECNFRSPAWHQLQSLKDLVKNMLTFTIETTVHFMPKKRNASEVELERLQQDILAAKKLHVEPWYNVCALLKHVHETFASSKIEKQWTCTNLHQLVTKWNSQCLRCLVVIFWICLNMFKCVFRNKRATTGNNYCFC